MKVVILAGGLGTRLSEETALRPKPMVEVGDRPILEHIMGIYAAHGFAEFVVALGYKGEVVKEHFLHYYARKNDLTVDAGTGAVKVYDHSEHPRWTVHLVNTGDATQTGGRLGRLRSWLADDGPFMLTYGDGVADVNIADLVAFHKSHGKLATVTAVRPPARFGGLVFDDTANNPVTEFTEKPQAGEGWINGGFFVFEPQVLDYITEDATILEREPLETLASEGQLMAFRHDGFWQAMDTLREKRLLESLWAANKAPWKVW